MFFPSPDLTDGTVRLRAWHEDDAFALARACADPEIPRFTRVPENYTLEDARWFLAGTSGRAASGEGLEFAVVAGAALLSSVALMGRDGGWEIGYWTAREARGRGVATRAVLLLSSWALGDAGLPEVSEIEILVSPENPASERVARAAGFESSGERLAELKGRFVPVRTFLRTRSP